MRQVTPLLSASSSVVRKYSSASRRSSTPQGYWQPLMALWAAGDRLDEVSALRRKDETEWIAEMALHLDTELS